jgi:hypothetical protein
MGNPVGPVLLLLVIALGSCRNTTTILSYTIRPPKPDTTRFYNLAMPATTDTFIVSGGLAATRILPPKPDTHKIERILFSTVEAIHINYYPAMPVGSGEMAYLIGEDNTVIDSAGVVSDERPVSFMGGTYYPSRVVFTLSQGLATPLVQVVIPNKTLDPSGKEVFFIQYQ